MRRFSAQIPAIAKTLPDPIDQMKLFELIQIVPTPDRSALESGDLLSYRVSEPDHHEVPAQQQHLRVWHRPTGRAPRRASARSSLRCGCSTAKFERAMVKYSEIKGR